MAKKYTTSTDLVRRPFVAPTQLAQLLKAAGIEHRAPEDVGGMLFGCLAHLMVGVFTQFPEHWPTFRAAFLEAADDLRDVITSDNPPQVVAGIMERQRQQRGERVK
jgi:hypothetical protein